MLLLFSITELAHDQTIRAGAPFGFLQRSEDASVITTLMRNDYVCTDTNLTQPYRTQHKKLSVPAYLSVDTLQQKNPVPLPLQMLNIKHNTYPYENVKSISQRQATTSMSKSLQDISSHNQFLNPIHQAISLSDSESNISSSSSLSNQFLHIPLATTTRASHDVPIKDKSASFLGQTTDNIYDYVYYDGASPGQHTIGEGWSKIIQL